MLRHVNVMRFHNERAGFDIFCRDGHVGDVLVVSILRFSG